MAQAQQMMQVQVPPGATPGQMFQVNVNGQVMSVMCPPGSAPGSMIQIGVGAPPTGAPQAQTMNDVSSLKQSTGFILKQKVGKLEAVSMGCCEQRNKYKLYDKSSGQYLYKAKEESDNCERCCCAPNHSLVVNIDNEDSGQTMYSVKKEFACGSCFACFDCCLPRATIYKGPVEDGKLLGSMKRPVCGGGLTPVLDLFDPAGAKTGQLTGPSCCIGSCCDTTFKYANTKGEEGGKIQKQQKKDAEGLAKELFTDADNFVLDFDQNMNEDEKGTLLGAMFLLDFMFFEGDGNLSCENGGIKIKFCDLYCCGCAIPCSCQCGGGD